MPPHTRPRNRPFWRSQRANSRARERTDRMDQLQRGVLTPSEILDEAHDEAVFFRRLEHERGDFRLAQCDESLKPTLSAYEIVARSARRACYCDRLLQPEMRDAVDQFLEDLLFRTRGFRTVIGPPGSNGFPARLSLMLPLLSRRGSSGRRRRRGCRSGRRREDPVLLAKPQLGVVPASSHGKQVIVADRRLAASIRRAIVMSGAGLVEPDLPAKTACGADLAPGDHHRGGELFVDGKQIGYRVPPHRAAVLLDRPRSRRLTTSGCIARSARLISMYR